jgi:hypothetical protein
VPLGGQAVALRGPTGLEHRAVAMVWVRVLVRAEAQAVARVIGRVDYCGGSGGQAKPRSGSTEYEAYGQVERHSCRTTRGPPKERAI